MAQDNNPEQREGDALTPSQARRRHWMGVLARADLQELESAWEGLPDKPAYEVLRAPEMGLAMVRARAGNSGKRFNLGEMTLTRCAVRLPGERVGFAWVMGQDVRKAELAAVFDGLMQDPVRVNDVERTVLHPLEARIEQRKALQMQLAEESKVDFFTLVRGS